ncbi:hypothetical protein F444_16208 [Phytophthora nicotianae P1976]|uniref:BZIP domain-containing protein n=1 Tax=Phytophthora nicotianae P1976 TaxID=1317066 RepID=A0A080ZJ90_PHYNI|nr:hypothetical protein F444_16208 [Phytophthora nicotianae P1976]
MYRILNSFNRLETLRSDVIGCALPRGSGANSNVYSETQSGGRFLSSTQSPILAVPPRPLSSQEGGQARPAQAKFERAVRDNAQHSSEAPGSRKSNLAKRRSQKADFDPAESEAKRPRKSTPWRREQCRVSQERYRQKRIAYVNQLECAVDELRHQVPLLEIQHARMCYCPGLTVWSVVTEYFHLFERGTDPIASSSQSWSLNLQAQRQVVFLRSTMARDIVLGDRRGIDALLEQWKWYSKCFEDVHLQLYRVTKASPSLVWVSSALRVTITRMTLEHVFPHLVGDSEKLWRFRLRIMGKRLALPCRLCFEWDEDTKRVARLETVVDFGTPLLQLLGNIEDAGFVLVRARITVDGAENGTKPHE